MRTVFCSFYINYDSTYVADYSGKKSCENILEPLEMQLDYLLFFSFIAMFQAFVLLKSTGLLYKNSLTKAALRCSLMRKLCKMVQSSNFFVNIFRK